MPKVTILMPIYNVEKYLNKCLDSVINQTLEDIEIICINDGSKDNCLEIIKKYASLDKRIKIIDKQNSGYGDSMNNGLEIATGEYIGIVEPDDYIKLNMFEKLYEEAKKFDADIVKSNFEVFTTNNKNEAVFSKVKLDSTNTFYNRCVKPLENLKVYTFPMYIWSGIYKKDFLNKNNIRFNTTPGAAFQDNGFFFQTFSLADKVCFMDEEFYFYRCDNPNASCNQAFKKNILVSQKEYTFIKNFISKHPNLAPNINYAYNWQKMQMYLPWYDKSTSEIWIDIAHKEFKEAYENSEIDFNLFDEKRRKYLETIIKNPSKFEKVYKKLNKKKVSLLKRIFSITNEYREDVKYKIVRILFMKFKIKGSK